MKLPGFTSIQAKKTWIILSVALAIGALAALGARGYLNKKLAEIDARARGKTVNAVVAKHELRKGEKISTETVAIRQIPVEFAHSQAVQPEHFDRIDGQPLAYPVKSGEMILWGLLENKRTPTFSVRVKPGHRAITVPVDEINSISGLLEPGDIIDLMAAVDQQGRKHIFTLLQNVSVMATGQRAENDPKSGEKRTYSTVTLDTSPQEALNIIRAREAGKLTALLRNPEDKNPLGKPLGDPGDFFDARKASPNSPTGGVPVLVGGRSGKIPLEGQYLNRPLSQEVGREAPDIRLPPPSVAEAARATHPVNVTQIQSPAQ